MNDIIAIVSLECRECAQLERRIARIAHSIGVELPEVQKVFFEEDPDHCMQVCMQWGVNEMPAFVCPGGLITKDLSDDAIAAILDS